MCVRTSPRELTADHDDIPLQKLRGAVEWSLAEAEELARQRPTVADGRNGTSPVGRNPNASPARSDSAARRNRTRKAGQDSSKDAGSGGDGTPTNPDPAIFEAAFVLDDSEGPSRAVTPRPPDKDGGDGEKTAEIGSALIVAESQDANEKDGPNGQKQALAAPNLDLPADIRLKLKKLEKLEATYPELLRSYRIAHGRAVSIEPFERALREHTPLTSIKDPNALVEYLSQVNLKADMVMQELKRVSAEKDEYQKLCGKKDEEVGALKEQLAGLKLSTPNQPAEGADRTGQKTTESSALVVGEESAKAPLVGALGKPSPKWDAKDPATLETDNESPSGQFFSYDDEIPKLQAEVTESLKTEIESLKTELKAAKASSDSLTKNLDAATRKLGESRHASAAAEESLRTQLETQNVRIMTLTEQLEKSTAALENAENRSEQAKVDLAASRQHSDELSLKLQKVTLAKVEIEKNSDAMSSAIAGLEEETAELQRRLVAFEASSSKPEPAEPPPQQRAPQPAPSAASKKKNRKKKKGGAGGGAQSAAGASEDKDEETGQQQQQQQQQPATTSTVDITALEEEVSRLRAAVENKDQNIERLSKQRKTEGDLREEVENLRENLIEIGQDHVEAKERIKQLENEKATLQSHIDELEKQLGEVTATSRASAGQINELENLRREYDDLKDKSHSLRTDLGAAEQLAQTRYRDITDLRDTLQKLQPELRSLRQDSSGLKSTKEELIAKVAELRNVERKEKEIKKELTRAQQTVSSRDSQVKSLEDKLLAETNNKLRLEEAQRIAGRDLRRSEAEKIEISSREEKLGRELKSVREEANKLRPRVRELEEEVEKLLKESAGLKEEAELKVQQYANAQGLLGGMRDQTAELTTQLREVRSQVESLEEELTEVQRLLSERSREGDTMRRLLEDADERADSRAREMRAQMEAAVEERDRIEDESNAAAQRRIRETEELKQKVRELERDVAALAHEKDDLEQRERDWHKRGEDLEAAESRASAGVEEMRSAMTGLQSTLEASEAQCLEAERQRADLRKLLDEAKLRHDKLAKELKTAQNKLGAGNGSGGSNASNASNASGRVSTDSTRQGAGAELGAGADMVYLKTILLQFLEQKDGRLRAQLVPVLGKLLRFEKGDEQKWMVAVQHLDIR